MPISASKYYGSASDMTGLPQPNVLHVQHQEAQNTAAGTFTSGAWRTRPLTTVLKNTITSASLGSNQVTLPAGTYRCQISVPGYGVTLHQAKLQSVSGTATLIYGTSTSTAGASAVQDSSLINGWFTLTEATVLEVQHQCSVTNNTNGMGQCCNFGTEVYTDALFIKQ